MTIPSSESLRIKKNLRLLIFKRSLPILSLLCWFSIWFWFIFQFNFLGKIKLKTLLPRCLLTWYVEEKKWELEQMKDIKMSTRCWRTLMENFLVCKSFIRSNKEYWKIGQREGQRALLLQYIVLSSIVINFTHSSRSKKNFNHIKCFFATQLNHIPDYLNRNQVQRRWYWWERNSRAMYGLKVN